MRPPKPYHNPPGPHPSSEGKPPVDLVEILQLLWRERYTGKFTIFFRSGQAVKYLRPGLPNWGAKGFQNE